MKFIPGNRLGQGRPKGSLNAKTIQWRSWAQRLCTNPEYQKSLRDRLLAGTLPPLVETRLWAYAFGEVPKEDHDRATGMIVQLGFVGSLPVQPLPVQLSPATEIVPTQNGEQDSQDSSEGSTHIATFNVVRESDG